MGRHASAGVDWKLTRRFWTYSRAKGLFAGVDLSGSWIEHDSDSTTALYGKDVSTTATLTVPDSRARRCQGSSLQEVARVKTEAEAR